jgi:hypothetical protein
MQTIRYATLEEVQADLKRDALPPAFSSEPSLPFDRMGDRSFECLLHDLAESHRRQDDRKFGTYDSAVLMQGVGERGRDIALIGGGKHVGAIQCKRYQGAITKPNAAREIIKYCLHALKDPELMPDPSSFTYVLAASRDFNEPAKMLLSGWKSRIVQEPELINWADEVIREYKRLEDLKTAIVVDQLKAMLEAITVVPIGFNDLDTLLTGESILLQKYFAVRTVVALEQLDPLKNMLEAIHRSLTDEDTRRLLDALNALPRESRVDFGLFSLWGYPSELLKRVEASGDFKHAGMRLVLAKAELDQLFMNELTSEIDNEIVAHVRGRFSPLIISAARPFLTGRLLMRWNEAMQGKQLSSILPAPSIQTDFPSVRKHVLDLGADYLRSDWSRYVGDPDLLALKKDIAKHTYGGYSDLAAMERQFDKEWPFIVTVLDQIEMRVATDIPGETIVVLRSMRMWDDEDHLKRVLTSAAEREKARTV